MPGEGRGLSLRPTQDVVRDREIGQPNNSEKGSETADGVTRESEGRSRVSLLRPVRQGQPMPFGGIFRGKTKTQRCSSANSFAWWILSTVGERPSLRRPRRTRTAGRAAHRQCAIHTLPEVDRGSRRCLAKVGRRFSGKPDWSRNLMSSSLWLLARAFIG